MKDGELRFIKRDGQRILQQCSANGLFSKWADVPLVSEPAVAVTDLSALERENLGL